MNNNSAFTLAETLITLVIIGVIAAITIPVIFENYRREEASARIKKFYSMLQNASTRAKADGKDWLDYAETASSSSDASTETIDSFAASYLYPYINYNKSEITESTKHPYLYTYLNDGTYFSIHKGTCLHFVFDLNGTRKPNAHGRDKFDFLYCGSDVDYYYGGGAKLIPYMPASMNTREKALSYCKSTPSSCVGLLLFDGWKFKKDYPYSI